MGVRSYWGRLSLFGGTIISNINHWLEGYSDQVLSKSWHCRKKRFGSDPCQDFFGEFDQMLIDQPKVITFPKGDHSPSTCKKMPRNRFDPPKYVNLCPFYWLPQVAFTHFLLSNPSACQNLGVGAITFMMILLIWVGVFSYPSKKNLVCFRIKGVHRVFQNNC